MQSTSDNSNSNISVTLKRRSKFLYICSHRYDRISQKLVVSYIKRWLSVLFIMYSLFKAIFTLSTTRMNVAKLKGKNGASQNTSGGAIHASSSNHKTYLGFLYNPIQDNSKTYSYCASHGGNRY